MIDYEKEYEHNFKAYVKEIHLLNNDIQYIITLSGDKITNDKFIIELLKTVKFY